MLRCLLAAIALLATPAYADPAVMRPRPLPPVEYDHPYSGILVTTTAHSIEELKTLCKPPAMLGCSYRYGNGCMIVLAPEADIKAAGWSVEIIKRHEVGHCNGWPPDHRNAREIPR